MTQNVLAKLFLLALVMGGQAYACDAPCFRIGGTVGAGYQKTKLEQSLDKAELENIEQDIDYDLERETKSIGFFPTLSGVRASYSFPIGVEVGLLHTLVSVVENKDDSSIQLSPLQLTPSEVTTYTVQASTSPYVSYLFQIGDATAVAPFLFLRLSKNINRTKDESTGAPIEDSTLTDSGRAPGIGVELQRSINGDVSLDMGAAYLSEKLSSEQDDHLSSDQEVHYELSGKQTTFGFYIGASWHFGGNE